MQLPTKVDPGEPRDGWSGQVHVAPQEENGRLVHWDGGINYFPNGGELYQRLFNVLKIEVPPIPGFPSLVIYKKETESVSSWDTCTPVFAAAKI